MIKFKLIETLSDKAVKAGSTIIVLSELSELKEPGYVGNIAYDSQYGIFYRLKGAQHRNILCCKDFSSAVPETEKDDYLKKLRVVYEFILKHWIQ